MKHVCILTFCNDSTEFQHLFLSFSHYSQYTCTIQWYFKIQMARTWQNGWSFDHPQNIKLPIAKEIGQSHAVKSTDPDTLTVIGLLSQNLYASKFLPLEKHYVIHATFLLDSKEVYSIVVRYFVSCFSDIMCILYFSFRLSWSTIKSIHCYRIFKIKHINLPYKHTTINKITFTDLSKYSW